MSADDVESPILSQLGSEKRADDSPVLSEFG